jgi:ribose 5-phosphate isomerase B
MKIYISSDHAGFELKQYLIVRFHGKGIELIDKGPATYDKADDYPDLIALVAAEVSADPENAKGIVIGNSGTR